MRQTRRGNASLPGRTLRREQTKRRARTYLLVRRQREGYPALHDLLLPLRWVHGRVLPDTLARPAAALRTTDQIVSGVLQHVKSNIDKKPPKTDQRRRARLTGTKRRKHGTSKKKRNSPNSRQDMKHRGRRGRVAARRARSRRECKLLLPLLLLLFAGCAHVEEQAFVEQSWRGG